jgi:Fe-S oxidoreductase
MNVDVFEKLIAREKEIMGEDTGGKHRFIEELIRLCKEHHIEGLSVYHLTHILGGVALGASILMEDNLEEAEEFARFLRDRSENTRKILSENWPPPDQTKWPYKN